MPMRSQLTGIAPFPLHSLDLDFLSDENALMIGALEDEEAAREEFRERISLGIGCYQVSSKPSAE